MRTHKLISAGFAIVALASAAIPAFAYTVWPDVDFEWYADVGKPYATPCYFPDDVARNSPCNTNAVTVSLAPREGYIVVPGRWENRGTRQVYVASHYVRDDYPQQLAVYNNPNGTTTYATGPLILRDRDGNIIPTQPGAYPVDSATR